MFLLRLSNNDISCLVLQIRIKIVSIRIQLLLKYFLTNSWIFLNFKNCKKLSQYLNFCNKIQIFLTNAFLMRIFYIYQSSNPAKLFGSGQIRIHNADHTRWHTLLGTIWAWTGTEASRASTPTMPSTTWSSPSPRDPGMHCSRKYTQDPVLLIRFGSRIICLTDPGPTLSCLYYGEKITGLLVYGTK